jgi:hypothetical protein
VESPLPFVVSFSRTQQLRQSSINYDTLLSTISQALHQPDITVYRLTGTTAAVEARSARQADLNLPDETLAAEMNPAFDNDDDIHDDPHGLSYDEPMPPLSEADNRVQTEQMNIVRAQLEVGSIAVPEDAVLVR